MSDTDKEMSIVVGICNVGEREFEAAVFSALNDMIRLKVLSYC
jgi:hypothetical protein